MKLTIYICDCMVIPEQFRIRKKGLFQLLKKNTLVIRYAEDELMWFYGTTDDSNIHGMWDKMQILHPNVPRISKHFIIPSSPFDSGFLNITYDHYI